MHAIALVKAFALGIFLLGNLVLAADEVKPFPDGQIESVKRFGRRQGFNAEVFRDFIEQKAITEKGQAQDALIYVAYYLVKSRAHMLEFVRAIKIESLSPTVRRAFLLRIKEIRAADVADIENILLVLSSVMLDSTVKFHIRQMAAEMIDALDRMKSVGRIVDHNPTLEHRFRQALLEKSFRELAFDILTTGAVESVLGDDRLATADRLVIARAANDATLMVRLTVSPEEAMRDEAARYLLKHPPDVAQFINLVDKMAPEVRSPTPVSEEAVAFAAETALTLAVENAALAEVLRSNETVKRIRQRAARSANEGVRWFNTQMDVLLAGPDEAYALYRASPNLETKHAIADYMGRFHATTVAEWYAGGDAAAREKALHFLGVRELTVLLTESTDGDVEQVLALFPDARNDRHIVRAIAAWCAQVPEASEKLRVHLAQKPLGPSSVTQTLLLLWPRGTMLEKKGITVALSAIWENASRRRLALLARQVRKAPKFLAALNRVLAEVENSAGEYYETMMAVLDVMTDDLLLRYHLAQSPEFRTRLAMLATSDLLGWGVRAIALLKKLDEDPGRMAGLRCVIELENDPPGYSEYVPQSGYPPVERSPE